MSKVYTEKERAEAMANFETAGKKGMKMPRVNLAFTPENHEYIQTMSRVRGETMTRFVNTIIEAHMKDHAEMYEQVKAFRNML